jgi:hypothetical protein
VVGQYPVSGGPLEGPGGPNGPPVYYLKYALERGPFSSDFSLYFSGSFTHLYQPKFCFKYVISKRNTQCKAHFFIYPHVNLCYRNANRTIRYDLPRRITVTVIDLRRISSPRTKLLAARCECTHEHFHPITMLNC